MGVAAKLRAALAQSGLRCWECTDPGALPDTAHGLLLGTVPPALAFRFVRAAGDRLQMLGALVALDGFLGYGTTPIADPESAALAGLVKTAQREWPALHARVIDPGPASVTAQCQALWRQGPVEIALGPGYCAGIGLRPAPRRPAPAIAWPAASGIVVSGGARGITAEVVVALAQKWRCRFLLLGRSPAPEALPAWARGVDDTALKQAVIQHCGLRQPQQIAARVRQLQADAAIAHTLARITAAGAQATYAPADGRDRAATQAAIAAFRATGPIHGLIHGAGVLADRRIVDQSDAQWERVYDTKVRGLDHLLAATATDPLQILIAFSSSTGRFGRSGQVAYAMANEVLSKRCQAWARAAAGRRALAAGWGPWDGGMVTAELKQLFAAEGITVIPRATGAAWCAAASAQDGPVETLILGQGSQLAADDPTIAAPALRLDPRHPDLQDHRLAGHPVAPLALLALALEAEAGSPGLDDLRLFQGQRFTDDDPARILTYDGLRLYHGRSPVAGAAPGASARALPALPAVTGPALPKAWYADGRLFHGPRYQVIESAVFSPGLFAATLRVDDHLRCLDAVLQALILYRHASRQEPCLPSAIGWYRWLQPLTAGPLQLRARIDHEDTQQLTAQVQVALGDQIILACGDVCMTTSPDLAAAFRS